MNKNILCIYLVMQKHYMNYVGPKIAKYVSKYYNI